MDFSFSQEELELIKVYKEYAEDRLRPLSLDIDQGTFDIKILTREVHDLGFCGIVIPEKYGGLGSTYMHYAIAVENLAYGCAPLAKTVGGQTNMCFPILKYGTEEQKNKYVTAWVKGEKASAFALTEPSAGSDAGAMKTEAVYRDGAYWVTGSKVFISGAKEADFLQTYCVVNDEGKKKSICLLIDTEGAEGLSFGKDEQLMGMRSCSVSEIVFEGVRVPEENLLGKVGKGFNAALATLDAGRLGISCLCIGMAQDAIDQTVRYTKDRMQFGRRISEFQNTQFKLAELQTRVEAARLLVYKCADSMDRNIPASHMASMAKYYASEVVNDTVRACLQLHGGYGYCKDFPIEKLYRDAKITEIFEGTSEIQKKIIAKWMGVN